MRVVPRAPFVDEYFPCDNNVQAPKPRTVEEIIDEALGELLPRIEKERYEGEVQTLVDIQNNDPRVSEIECEFIKMMKPKGYDVSVSVENESSVGRNGYLFTITWLTPHGRLLDIVANPDIPEARKYEEIGAFINRRAPSFQKVYPGLWKLDLRTDELELDDANLTLTLLRDYNYRAFIKNGIVYIFTTDELDKPKN